VVCLGAGAGAAASWGVAWCAHAALAPTMKAAASRRRGNRRGVRRDMGMTSGARVRPVAWRAEALTPALARKLSPLYVDVNINVPSRSSPRLVTPGHSPRVDALAMLRLIIESLRRSARSVETRAGVTNAQLFLLQELGARGPLSVNDLAVSARTSPSTASIVVQRLVRAGLAGKARSRADARSVTVTLTPAGRRVVRRAPEPTTARVFNALESISEADARALSRGLRALARALKLTPHAPTMLFEDPPVRHRSK